MKRFPNNNTQQIIPCLTTWFIMSTMTRDIQRPRIEADKRCKQGSQQTHNSFIENSITCELPLPFNTPWVEAQHSWVIPTSHSPTTTYQVSLQSLPVLFVRPF